MAGEIHQRVVESCLAGVYFPRMDIEGPRNAAALALAQRCLHDAVGQQPEVRAARGGETQAAPPQRSWRDFQQSTSGTLEPVRIPRCTGIAEAVAPDRKQTVFVPIAFFDQHGER